MRQGKKKDAQCHRGMKVWVIMNILGDMDLSW